MCKLCLFIQLLRTDYEPFEVPTGSGVCNYPTIEIIMLTLLSICLTFGKKSTGSGRPTAEGKDAAIQCKTEEQPSASVGYYANYGRKFKGCLLNCTYWLGQRNILKANFLFLRLKLDSSCSPPPPHLCGYSTILNTVEPSDQISCCIGKRKSVLTHVEVCFSVQCL